MHSGLKLSKLYMVRKVALIIMVASISDVRCIIDSKILHSLAPSIVWDKIISRKAISCPSCNGNVESSNHIFFECNIAKGIWMLVHKRCDISFPPFTSTLETTHAIRGMPLIKAKRYLEDVLAHKQAITFTRLCRGVGRTSWTSKESPFKWTRTFHFADVDALHIFHIQVNQTQKQKRRTSRAHGRINLEDSN
ncbi:60S ribosomal protein L17-2-like protein [Tanacetum coccineum]